METRTPLEVSKHRGVDYERLERKVDLISSQVNMRFDESNSKQCVFETISIAPSSPSPLCASGFRAFVNKRAAASPLTIGFNTGSEISSTNRTKNMACSGTVSLSVSQSKNCAGTWAVRAVKMVSSGSGYSFGGSLLRQRAWGNGWTCMAVR